jgi:hypothetical protein
MELQMYVYFSEYQIYSGKTYKKARDLSTPRRDSTLNS